MAHLPTEAPRFLGYSLESLPTSADTPPASSQTQVFLPLSCPARRSGWTLRCPPLHQMQGRQGLGQSALWFSNQTQLSGVPSCGSSGVFCTPTSSCEQLKGLQCWLGRGTVWRWGGAPPSVQKLTGTQAGRKAHHDFTPDTEQWTPSCPGRDSGRVSLIQVTSTLPRAGAPPQPQGPPTRRAPPGHSEPRPLITHSAAPTPREVVLCSLVNQRCVFLCRLQAGPHSPLLTSSHKYAGAGLPHRRWGNPANKPDLPCGSHIWRERQTINRKTNTCQTCQGRAEAWTPAPPP